VETHSPFQPITNSTHSTKDELQALEADLQHLAISNRDLAHSNKTLTDTIAAISQAPISSAEPRPKDLRATDSAIHLQGNPKDQHVASLIAMPSVSLPSVVRRRPIPPTPVADHLLLCMKSVQELATAITSALEALHGQDKTGSSDVHGSYAKLSANLQRLPQRVQCVHCTRSVAWQHIEPIQPDLTQLGACICMRQSSPSIWKPCDIPADKGESERGSAPLSTTKVRASSMGLLLKTPATCIPALRLRLSATLMCLPCIPTQGVTTPGCGVSLVIRFRVCTVITYLPFILATMLLTQMGSLGRQRSHSNGRRRRRRPRLTRTNCACHLPKDGQPPSQVAHPWQSKSRSTRRHALA
jgi:hypothetical protein